MTGYIKRINSVGDLVEKEIIETEQLRRNQSASRAKNFKTAVMVTGVNDSSKEDKFVSGSFKLTEGRALKTGDKGKVLLHKKLAEKNNLKVGDKFKIKSNLYDLVLALALLIILTIVISFAFNVTENINRARTLDRYRNRECI